jgi:hypothetical protein
VTKHGEIYSSIGRMTAALVGGAPELTSFRRKLARSTIIPIAAANTARARIAAYWMQTAWSSA